MVSFILPTSKFQKWLQNLPLVIQLAVGDFEELQEQPHFTVAPVLCVCVYGGVYMCTLH